MPYDLLDGVKVIELSMYAFAPASAAVLSDWGADVVKVVPPNTADPMMSGRVVGGLPDIDTGVMFMWENLNRGKRCVCIDVSTPEGRDLLHRMARRADVFITNLLPGARERFGVDPDTMAAINPRLIYGRATGHGERGPERERGGFDHTDFWARSGIAHTIANTMGEFVAQPGPAMGDVTAGAHLAGAIAAALYRRERTGKGAIIDVSLLSTGVWMNGPALQVSHLYGIPTIPRYRREDQPNPLVTAYATRDGRHIYIAGVQTEKKWEEFCAVLEADHLVGDPLLATGELRLANARYCSGKLDEAFARHDLDYWLERFQACPVPWAVVQSSAETYADRQVEANGMVTTIEGDTRSYPVAASPAQVDDKPLSQTRAPQHGEHTEVVLMEYGVEWDEIEALKKAGAVN
ncbi:MAG: CoA transferase [Novosphingobium sp.]|nr:CoA transferase [Novosphingobium sp.]